MIYVPININNLHNYMIKNKFSTTSRISFFFRFNVSYIIVQ